MLDNDIISPNLQDLNIDPHGVPDISENIGRYIIKSKLGMGNMRKVYLAQDPFLDREVAIKVVSVPSNTVIDSDEGYKIFFEEARSIAGLIHPNIVELYDVMIEGDNYYLAMEYVEGTTLKEYCGNNSELSLERILNIIFQCAKALDYASSNGILHQSIRPNKILISSNDEVKIRDFNFTKFTKTSNADPSDAISGSALYTAPEVIRNEQPTAQSDIFSLGIVIYELLSGNTPFKGDTEVAICYEILNKDPEPLGLNTENVPEILDLIVSKALEKDPANRFQTGSELASVLSKSYDSIRFLNDRIELQEKSNALRNLKFFKNFTSGELNEVLETTQWLKYDAGDTIISEGEIDDSFYIIVLGDVVVSKNSKAIAALKQGDCFGEMAYLGKTRRAADIKALCRTVLMKVNSTIMEKTSLNTQNRFYKVFSKTLIYRLDRVNRLLIKNSAF